MLGDSWEYGSVPAGRKLDTRRGDSTASFGGLRDATTDLLDRLRRSGLEERDENEFTWDARKPIEVETGESWVISLADPVTTDLAAVDAFVIRGGMVVLLKRPGQRVASSVSLGSVGGSRATGHEPRGDFG